MAKHSLNMKKIILKKEKICHESWISIGRFCFWSRVTEKALEKMGLSQHLTTAVISTRVWDSAWEQRKLEARKMLVNRADSHTSGAP
jgi:predicted HAD superfamily hydrolase